MRNTKTSGGRRDFIFKLFVVGDEVGEKEIKGKKESKATPLPSGFPLCLSDDFL